MYHIENNRSTKTMFKIAEDDYNVELRIFNILKYILLIGFYKKIIESHRVLVDMACNINSDHYIVERFIAVIILVSTQYLCLKSTYM